MNGRSILSLLILQPVLLTGAARAQEPDGSRPALAGPLFKAEPAPPAWLRATSHAAAFVDTRHYLYEAYAAAAGTESKWIVRYVMLPEGNEAFREIEQVFLFDGNPKHKPKNLKPAEITFDPQRAVWKNTSFNLVDRRDLAVP